MNKTERQKATNADSTFQKLQRLLKHDYFNIGFRVQTLGTYRLRSWNAMNNGISVEAARIKASGKIGGGFGYRMQADFGRTPSILDARIDYKILSDLTMATGKYKAPFSFEELKSSANLDLISRSQVVNNLAPGRQTGVTLEGNLGFRLLGFAAGAFNKKQNNTATDEFFRESYLYVVRLSTRKNVNDFDDDRFDELYDEHFTAGVNAGYEDDCITVARRLLAGVDLRWAAENYFLSGEFIYQHEDLPGGVNRFPFGYHLTGGWVFPSERQQLVLRWDSFDPDLPVNSKSNLLVLGYNLRPTKITRLQFNYTIPTRKAAFENHQIKFLIQVDI